MHLTIRHLLICLAVSLLASTAQAQETKCNQYNFKDKKAHIVNLAPGFEITRYAFCNTDGQNFRGQFVENLSWKNTGTQPVVSFEIITIKYDAFNRRMIGSRAAFAGKSSADWAPLAPGATGSDGLLDPGTAHVYTAIAYVRAVRFGDGNVWIVESGKLAEAVKKVVSDFKDLGDLSPDKPVSR